MGRAKVKIEKQKLASSRQITYSKRKFGLIKKTQELSILCDIDIGLIMFSPTGKPTLSLGEESELSEILERFSNTNPRERAKRKLETLQALKKSFKNNDHEVNVEEMLGQGTSRIKELNDQISFLHAQIYENERKLSVWTDPKSVDELTKLDKMEESLVLSLARLRMQKSHFFGVQPQHDSVHERLEADLNAAMAHRDLEYIVSASGPTESAAMGVQPNFQYLYTPNINLTGIDNHTPGFNLNPGEACFNPDQLFDQNGYFGDLLPPY